MHGNGRRFKDFFSRLELKKWEFSINVLSLEILIILLFLRKNLNTDLNISEIGNDECSLSEEVSNVV